MSAAQGTNDKLYLARALRRGLGHDSVSQVTSLCLTQAPGVIKSARPLTVHFRLARAPWDHQKCLTPRVTFPPR
jgi:hypothetical protein